MLSPPPASSIAEALQTAEAHVHAGRMAEAFALYDGALAAAPENEQILFGVGILAIHFDRPERGAELLRRAIGQNPDNANYHIQLGAALVALGRLDEAAAAVDRALQLDPRNAEALCNLGCILFKRGDFAAALNWLQTALDIDPGLAVAHHNVGAILQAQGQINEAIVSFRTAVTCAPDFAPPYAGLAKCLTLLPDASPGLIAEATRRWARLLRRPPDHPGWRNVPALGRKLRVGYVSADLRGHSVAIFLESVLAAHDRDAVEITCYSNSEIVDDTTERLKAVVDRWHPIDKLGDAASGALIRSDAIDILVDLSGHTDGNRLPLFASRPAPVQCTWLGYYATTGLPEIDYIIADRLVVPPGDEAYYTETPWRLPDSYLCFTPPAADMPVGPLPALDCGVVTFGSCNAVTKVNKRVVAVWTALLRAVPGSRLVLRSHTLNTAPVREELARQLIAGGIAADRFTLLPGAGRLELLATYDAIDIALDPFPYGGGTTTAEALWMGVPVVSLRGDRFTGRVSESILTTIGLPDLVVADEGRYVAAAAALAADLPRLAALRAGLRDKLVGSPLCDAPRFARHLEEAYRAMWHAWCQGKEIAA